MIVAAGLSALSLAACQQPATKTEDNAAAAADAAADTAAVAADQAADAATAAAGAATDAAASAGAATEKAADAAGSVELWRVGAGWKAVWAADVRGQRPWTRQADPDFSDSGG